MDANKSPAADFMPQISEIPGPDFPSPEMMIDVASARIAEGHPEMAREVMDAIKVIIERQEAEGGEWVWNVIANKPMRWG